MEQPAIRCAEPRVDAVVHQPAQVAVEIHRANFEGVLCEYDQVVKIESTGEEIIDPLLAERGLVCHLVAGGHCIAAMKHNIKLRSSFS